MPGSVSAFAIIGLNCAGRAGLGRPPVSKEIRALIRRMSAANVGWGSPRIVGEPSKLGIDVAKSTVEKCRVRSKKPPSPTWKAFLKNHVRDLVSIDFLVVPTMRFKVLFVLVILAHHRRRVVHFNVTGHPTARWSVQQIVEAFPWDTAPKYLLRDRTAARWPGVNRTGSPNRVTCRRGLLCPPEVEAVRQLIAPPSPQENRPIGIAPWE